MTTLSTSDNRCLVSDSDIRSESVVDAKEEVVFGSWLAEEDGGSVAICVGVVFPKKHYQIVEQIPDYEFGHLMNVVNKISTAVFEGAGAQGTNIIIQNGLAAGQQIPHVSVHIIPRRENDNLVLQWDTKQLPEEEMSTVELQLKEETKNIGAFQKAPKAEPVKLEKKPEKVEPELSDQENYLIKQLRRIP